MTLPRNCDRIADGLGASRHSHSSFPDISASNRPPARDPGTKHGTVFCANVVLALMIGCSVAHAESMAVQSASQEAARVPFAAFVAEASQRFGIPASWIHAVMRVESFDDMRAISPKGAMGLMQIMPGTWDELRERYRLGADPYDAHDNIIAGAGFLRELHDRYGAPGFLAAYNAGPSRWEDHLATGRPLPAETRAYLARLTPIIGGGDAVDRAILLASAVRSWAEASLFPTQPARPSHDSQSALTQQSLRPSKGHPAQDWTALAPRSDRLFVSVSNRQRSP
ncbi:MAG TPA: lytic transglycosylase domain-containing protein [Methylocella sp.]|nr:lytic transglycosylase domain-containing protein [Methylocella sp.]